MHGLLKAGIASARSAKGGGQALGTGKRLSGHCGHAEGNRGTVCGCRRPLDFFLDAGRLARSAPQVVKLGASYLAFAFHLDACNQWTVRLKGALNTFSVGELSHCKSGVQPSIAFGNYNPFKSLQTLPAPFPHLDLHYDGIAGIEFRNVVFELLPV